MNPNNYMLKVDGGEEITIHGVNSGPGDGVRGEAIIGAGVRGISRGEGAACGVGARRVWMPIWSGECCFRGQCP